MRRGPGEIWPLYRVFSKKFQLAAPSISLTRKSYAMRRFMLRGGGFSSTNTEDVGEYEKRLKRGVGLRGWEVWISRGRKLGEKGDAEANPLGKG